MDFTYDFMNETNGYGGDFPNIHIDDFRTGINDEGIIKNDTEDDEGFSELLDLNNFFFSTGDKENNGDQYADNFDFNLNLVNQSPLQSEDHSESVVSSNPSVVNTDNDIPVEVDVENALIGQNISDMSSIIANNTISKTGPFILALYSIPKVQSLENVTTFQLPNETRMKYLIRYPKLQEQFFNSGDLEKLKILFNDVMVKDVVVLNHSFPLFVGRNKVFEIYVSLLRNIPDVCVFNKRGIRSGHRTIMHQASSYGSAPYVHANDKSTEKWNIFENTPVEKLDAFHKIQKQKYDMLKSQNKMIRYEKSSIWYLSLDKELQHFSKMRSTNEKVEILV